MTARSIGSALRWATLTICFLARGVASAADWVERPYNPPLGSRWTIERDLATEEDKWSNLEEDLQHHRRAENRRQGRDRIPGDLCPARQLLQQ
jgi:hypothetical protein